MYCSLPVTCHPSSLRLAVGSDALVLHQVTLCSGCTLRAFVSRTALPHPVTDARGPSANSPHRGHPPSAEPSPPGVARVTAGLPITQPTEWVKSLACQTHVLLLEGESGPRCPPEDAPRGEGPDTQAWPSSGPSSELYREWTDAS